MVKMMKSIMAEVKANIQEEDKSGKDTDSRAGETPAGRN